MRIKKIELTNFRNYAVLDLSFHPHVNLILGDNAQGKTNLLEGIYLAAIGRSFRTGKDSELVRFGQEFAKVCVEAEKKEDTTSVEIRIKKDAKKSVKKDGVVVRRTSELLENILIVIFSPEDLKIVKDEPEKRRRFIDRELCQIKPRYYDSLANYKKVLLQRNMYLKEEQLDSTVLDIWDRQLARYGAQIMEMRAAFIEKISGYSGEIHSSITGGKEHLTLHYEPNVQMEASGEALAEVFYEKIRAAFPNDSRQRTTTCGPHKDDLSFCVNTVNMRQFGSQGQQRTCALALKLAELYLIREETGEDAILLLDDVMSELDATRQAFLIKTLQENQLFITDTSMEPELLRSFPDARQMYVRQGEVEIRQ